MKAAELARRLKEPVPDPFQPSDWNIALQAWLLNLWRAFDLGAPLLNVEEFTKVFETQPDHEVADDKMQEAHKALAFPWSRAIISRLLYGPGEVTPRGIPAWYDKPKEEKGTGDGGQQPG